MIREEGESPNDRNDRGISRHFPISGVLDFRIFSGIRRATSWYNSHLSLARPPVRGQSRPPLPVVVLISDDVANRQKAEKEGLSSISGMSHAHFRRKQRTKTRV